MQYGKHLHRMLRCEDKSVGIELRSLKKPSALDKVINVVPKPKGAVPNFGLPRWRNMPLESKIPMIPGPPGAYNFSRKKLGKRLWTGSANAEFDIHDLASRDMEFSYDPLHDEHLASFFAKPNNRKRLINLGLVTKKLDAICSLRDYNMYRKYLKKLHNDSINQELNKLSRMNDDKRALDLAEMFGEKDDERMRMRDEKYRIRLQVQEEYKKEMETNIQRQKEKQLRSQERTRMLELKRKEDCKRRAEEGKKRSAMIKQRLEQAAYIERQNIIKTLKEWFKNDHERKKIREKRILREAEEKRNAINEKWQLRNEFQEKQMEREEFLYHCLLEQHTANVAAYNAKVQNEREKMSKKLEQRKIFVKCYTKRHISGQREGTCCIKRKKPRKNKADGRRNPCPYEQHPNPVNKKKWNNQGNGGKRLEGEVVRSKQKKKKAKRQPKAVRSMEPIYKPKVKIRFTNTKISPLAISIPPSSSGNKNCKCDYV